MKTITVSHVPRSNSGLHCQDLISLMVTGQLSARFVPLFVSPSFELLCSTSSELEYIYLGRGKYVNSVIKLGQNGLCPPELLDAVRRAAKARGSWSSSWCPLRIRIGRRVLHGVSVRCPQNDREQNQGTCISQIT